MLGFRLRAQTAMGGPASDDFTGVDGTSLAGRSTPVGGLLWSLISGAWTIQTNQANTATVASSSPIAVVDYGLADVDIGLDVSPTGNDAIYFRVQDATNWWRLRLREYTTSSTYTNYCTYTSYYSYIFCSTTTACTGQTEFDGPSVCGSCPIAPYGYGCTNDGYIYQCPDSNTRYCASNGTCQQACGTGTNYYYNYYLELEKMIAGTLTSVAEVSLGQSVSITHLRVVALGNSITAYANGTSQGSWTDSALVTVTQHGIGRGDQGDTSQDGQAIDNFSISHAV